MRRGCGAKGAPNPLTPKCEVGEGGVGRVRKGCTVRGERLETYSVGSRGTSTEYGKEVGSTGWEGKGEGDR